MNQDDVGERYYSIKEFSVKLNVHPNTVRNAIKSGRISAFRVGAGQKSIYRIAHSELGRIALFDLRVMIKKILKEENGENLSSETA